MSPISIKAQGNCLFYPEDSGERIACELSYRAIEYPQGSKESQILFDAAIEIGPKYAWAYYEKSVAFFKRGLFSEGVEILNHAIDLEPENYLYYRAYWYYYNGSYKASAEDLTKLYDEYKAPITYTPGGDREMRIIQGLAYAQIGETSKGIQCVLDCLDSYGGQEYLIGLYDYHTLGVLYFENDEHDKAISALEKQIEVNPQFADSYYYLGLIYKAKDNKNLSQKYLNQSLSNFDGENGGYGSNNESVYNVSKEMVLGELNP